MTLVDTQWQCRMTVSPWAEQVSALRHTFAVGRVAGGWDGSELSYVDRAVRLHNYMGVPIERVSSKPKP